MSSELILLNLRACFELHRSRGLRIKRKCLVKSSEILKISPDTTDLEDLETIRRKEWPTHGSKPLPQPIKSSADLYALIDDSTKAPLPEEERLKIYAEIEAVLQELATLDSDPATLPDDFKQLCALTNSLKGPALPSTNSQIPDAFSGLRMPLWELKRPFFSPDDLESSMGLWGLHYTPTVILLMGGMEAAIGGGCWLCWCKDYPGDWAWRWATRVGHVQPPEIYEDVEDLLDRYCETYLDIIIYPYGDDIGEGVL
jgi:hypothetical protein